VPGFPQGALSGKIALISTGQCSYATKVLNAQAAGAVVVLLFPGIGWFVADASYGAFEHWNSRRCDHGEIRGFPKELSIRSSGAVVTLDPTVVES